MRKGSSIAPPIASRSGAAKLTTSWIVITTVFFVGTSAALYLIFDALNHRPLPVQALAGCFGAGMASGFVLTTARSHISGGPPWRRKTGGERGDTDPAELVTTIGQELRTPLTSVVGYIELLSEGEIGCLDSKAATCNQDHQAKYRPPFRPY